MKLSRWDARREGPLNEAALRGKLEALGYSVDRWVYPPGTVFDFHTHPHPKIDGVLSGRFAMTMDGETVVLEAGDCLEVPAGTSHRAEVLGDVPVVSLDASKRG